MQDNSALITTVLPTFQRPDLLRRAIASVLDQGVDRLQLCVYDNASEDRTAEVVAGIAAEDPRVKYFRHDVNIGPMANFNFGLARVDTPFFSMLSDDDILLPRFYSDALAALDSSSDTIFYSGRTIIFDELRNEIYAYGASWVAGRHDPSSEVMAHMIREHLPSTGILWRQSVLDIVPQLDQYGSDDNFVVKVAAQGSFLVSDNPTAVFFRSPQGYTGALLTGAAVSGDGPGPYLEPLVGRPRQLQADLLALKTVDLTARLRAARALSAELRRDLLAYFLFTVLPANRVKEMQLVKRELVDAGVAPGWNIVLGITVWIGATRTALARAQARLAATVAWAHSRRRVRRHQPFDAEIRAFVARANELGHALPSSLERRGPSPSPGEPGD